MRRSILDNHVPCPCSASKQTSTATHSLPDHGDSKQSLYWNVHSARAISLSLGMYLGLREPGSKHQPVNCRNVQFRLSVSLGKEGKSYMHKGTHFSFFLLDKGKYGLSCHMLRTPRQRMAWQSYQLYYMYVPDSAAMWRRDENGSVDQDALRNIHSFVWPWCLGALDVVYHCLAPLLFLFL